MGLRFCALKESKARKPDAGMRLKVEQMHPLSIMGASGRKALSRNWRLADLGLLSLLSMTN
jgi:hypothetical protein